MPIIRAKASQPKTQVPTREEVRQPKLRYDTHKQTDPLKSDADHLNEIKLDTKTHQTPAEQRQDHQDQKADKNNEPLTSFQDTMNGTNESVSSAPAPLTSPGRLSKNKDTGLNDAGKRPGHRKDPTVNKAVNGQVVIDTFGSMTCIMGDHLQNQDICACYMSSTDGSTTEVDYLIPMLAKDGVLCEYIPVSAPMSNIVNGDRGSYTAQLQCAEKHILAPKSPTREARKVVRNPSSGDASCVCRTCIFRLDAEIKDKIQEMGHSNHWIRRQLSMAHINTKASRDDADEALGPPSARWAHRVKPSRTRSFRSRKSYLNRKQNIEYSNRLASLTKYNEKYRKQRENIGRVNDDSLENLHSSSHSSFTSTKIDSGRLRRGRTLADERKTGTNENPHPVMKGTNCLLPLPSRPNKLRTLVTTGSQFHGSESMEARQNAGLGTRQPRPLKPESARKSLTHRVHMVESEADNFPNETDVFPNRKWDASAGDTRRQPLSQPYIQSLAYFGSSSIQQTKEEKSTGFAHIDTIGRDSCHSITSSSFMSSFRVILGETSQHGPQLLENLDLHHRNHATKRSKYLGRKKMTCEQDQNEKEVKVPQPCKQHGELDDKSLQSEKGKEKVTNSRGSQWQSDIVISGQCLHQMSLGVDVHKHQTPANTRKGLCSTFHLPGVTSVSTDNKKDTFDESHASKLHHGEPINNDSPKSDRTAFEEGNMPKTYRIPEQQTAPVKSLFAPTHTESKMSPEVSNTLLEVRTQSGGVPVQLSEKTDHDTSLGATGHSQGAKITESYKPSVLTLLNYLLDSAEKMKKIYEDSHKQTTAQGAIRQNLKGHKFHPYNCSKDLDKKVARRPEIQKSHSLTTSLAEMRKALSLNTSLYEALAKSDQTYYIDSNSHSNGDRSTISEKLGDQDKVAVLAEHSGKQVKSVINERKARARNCRRIGRPKNCSFNERTFSPRLSRQSPLSNTPFRISNHFSRGMGNGSSLMPESLSHQITNITEAYESRKSMSGDNTHITATELLQRFANPATTPPPSISSGDLHENNFKYSFLDLMPETITKKMQNKRRSLLSKRGTDLISGIGYKKTVNTDRNIKSTAIRRKSLLSIKKENLPVKLEPTVIAKEIKSVATEPKPSMLGEKYQSPSRELKDVIAKPAEDMVTRRKPPMFVKKTPSPTRELRNEMIKNEGKNAPTDDGALPSEVNGIVVRSSKIPMRQVNNKPSLPNQANKYSYEQQILDERQEIPQRVDCSSNIGQLRADEHSRSDCLSEYKDNMSREDGSFESNRPSPGTQNVITPKRNNIYSKKQARKVYTSRIPVHLKVRHHTKSSYGSEYTSPQIMEGKPDEKNLGESVHFIPDPSPVTSWGENIVPSGPATAWSVNKRPGPTEVINHWKISKFANNQSKPYSKSEIRKKSHVRTTRDFSARPQKPESTPVSATRSYIPIATKELRQRLGKAPPHVADRLTHTINHEAAPPGGKCQSKPKHQFPGPHNLSRGMRPASSSPPFSDQLVQNQAARPDIWAKVEVGQHSNFYNRAEKVDTKSYIRKWLATLRGNGCNFDNGHPCNRGGKILPITSGDEIQEYWKHMDSLKTNELPRANTNSVQCSSLSMTGQPRVLGMSPIEDGYGAPTSSFSLLSLGNQISLNEDQVDRLARKPEGFINDWSFLQKGSDFSALIEDEEVNISVTAVQSPSLQMKVTRIPRYADSSRVTKNKCAGKLPFKPKVIDHRVAEKSDGDTVVRNRLSITSIDLQKKGNESCTHIDSITNDAKSPQTLIGKSNKFETKRTNYRQFIKQSYPDGGETLVRKTSRVKSNSSVLPKPNLSRPTHNNKNTRSSGKRAIPLKLGRLASENNIQTLLLLNSKNDKGDVVTLDRLESAQEQKRPNTMTLNEHENMKSQKGKQKKTAGMLSSSMENKELNKVFGQPQKSFPKKKERLSFCGKGTATDILQDSQFPWFIPKLSGLKKDGTGALHASGRKEFCDSPVAHREEKLGRKQASTNAGKTRRGMLDKEESDQAAAQAQEYDVSKPFKLRGACLRGTSDAEKNKHAPGFISKRSATTTNPPARFQSSLLSPNMDASKTKTSPMGSLKSQHLSPTANRSNINEEQTFTQLQRAKSKLKKTNQAHCSRVKAYSIEKWPDMEASAISSNIFNARGKCPQNKFVVYAMTDRLPPPVNVAQNSNQLSPLGEISEQTRILKKSSPLTWLMDTSFLGANEWQACKADERSEVLTRLENITSSIVERYRLPDSLPAKIRDINEDSASSNPCTTHTTNAGGVAESWRQREEKDVCGHLSRSQRTKHVGESSVKSFTCSVSYKSGKGLDCDQRPRKKTCSSNRAITHVDCSLPVVPKQTLIVFGNGIRNDDDLNDILTDTRPGFNQQTKAVAYKVDIDVSTGANKTNDQPNKHMTASLAGKSKFNKLVQGHINGSDTKRSSSSPMTEKEKCIGRFAQRIHTVPPTSALQADLNVRSATALGEKNACTLPHQEVASGKCKSDSNTLALSFHNFSSLSHGLEENSRTDAKMHNRGIRVHTTTSIFEKQPLNQNRERDRAYPVASPICLPKLLSPIKSASHQSASLTSSAFPGSPFWAKSASMTSLANPSLAVKYIENFTEDRFRNIPIQRLTATTLAEAQPD